MTTSVYGGNNRTMPSAIALYRASNSADGWGSLRLIVRLDGGFTVGSAACPEAIFKLRALVIIQCRFVRNSRAMFRTCGLVDR